LTHGGKKKVVCRVVGGDLGRENHFDAAQHTRRAFGNTEEGWVKRRQKGSRERKGEKAAIAKNRLGRTGVR